MAFCFEKPLCFNRRHTTGARSGDGLAISPVLYVASVENTLDIRPGAAVRNDVAVRIEIELAGKCLGVRDVSDGDKETIHLAVIDAR